MTCSRKPWSRGSDGNRNEREVPRHGSGFQFTRPPGDQNRQVNPNANFAALTTYTATVKGGTSDLRVKDRAGNALAVDRTWTFTTR